jgi:16S rRNA (adenine1518-N6/adenine1519-N6)-dimethyltransferase
MKKPSTISGLRELMLENNIRPKKRWGQNFLVDGNILSKIAKFARADHNGYIVEIGPGLGALTEELAIQHKGILAIDIDHSLEPALRQVLSPYDNVHLIFQDIMATDIEKELTRSFQLESVPNYIVCANIPYNITTPIVFKLLEQCPNLKSAILMMQKEVAGRIMAAPGGKDYGLLTLTVAYHAQAKFLMNVSPSCFYPRPEVESTVIEITPTPGKRVRVNNEKEFIMLLKFAFQKRRKTMLNIAADFFSCDKILAKNILEEINISPARRPETLALEDFARLANAFLEKNFL